MNLNLIKSKKQNLLITLAIYVLWPPLAVVIPCWFIGYLNTDEVIRIATSPVLVGIMLLIGGVIVATVNYYIKTALAFVEEGNNERAQKKLYSLPFVILLVLICYATAATPIGKVIDLSEDKILCLSIYAPFVVLLSSMPVILMLIKRVDEIFEETPIIETLKIGVRLKLVGTTIVAAIGSIGMLTILSYMLIFHNTVDGQVMFTASDYLYNMSLLSVFVLIQLALPSMLISNQISNQLVTLSNSIKIASTGNLRVKIQSSSRDEIGLLGSNVKIMLDNMTTSVKTISEVTSVLDEASLEVNKSATGMSQKSSEHAASAEELAASVEELTATILNNTSDAEETGSIVQEINSEIIQGSDAINKALASMQNIADKISVIDEIARQTNLLALNAAVEAARAGDMGKGFAVVAAEVRRLAENSQKSAADIIESSTETVHVSKEASTKFVGIVPNIQKSTLLMDKVVMASREQNVSIDQINIAIQQFNSIIQDTVISSSLMTENSKIIEDESTKLKTAVNFFQI